MLLCIALVVAVGTIQAVHVHPQDDLAHSDCALCVTAHLAVQVAEPPVTLSCHACHIACRSVRRAFTHADLIDICTLHPTPAC